MNIYLIILIIFCLILLTVFIYDVFIQKKYPILHNFPIIGHLRHLFILVGPELRQYWVANDKEEQPFNRSERDWIYTSAKGENNTFGFGTSELIYGVGYPIIKHATIPFPSDKLKDHSSNIQCLKIIGEFHKREKPFRPKSIINISAMSFGSLSANAVSSMNIGAAIASCYHNTGEGSVSKYHKNGADLIWQIGTAYFGCRDEEGEFSLDILSDKCRKNKNIKAIEIKLSQGAKPGKGGILPKEKITTEIAEARNIPKGKDCISPNYHKEFSTPDELIDFVEKIAKATGLPVGVKAAIGKTVFWEELAIKMSQRNQGPDFIAVDGGEGGTGAAPLTFSDHVSLPFKIGFSRVYKIFQQQNISQRIFWIGSGRLGFPDRAIIAMAMGCDAINIAREAMLSIGCIQAQQCHTGHCPSGIATQSKWLQNGINVDNKSKRLASYVKSFRKELLSLAHAAGYDHPAKIRSEDIEFSSGVNKFSTLEEVLGYSKDSISLE
jgi:glutamate synthase domain-containing protein 2